MVLDLGEARDNEEFYIRYWKNIYIGACDGDAKIRFNTKRNTDFNPDEFSKLTDLRGTNFMLISNDAQNGKELVIYYEQDMRKRWF